MIAIVLIFSSCQEKKSREDIQAVDNSKTESESSYKTENGDEDSLFSQGLEIYRINNYSAALDLFSQSLNQARNENNILLQARCLEQMGSVNLELGNDHEALKLYYEALPLFEKISDKEGIAKVYNIIGVSKSSQQQYDTAESYFLKAMKLNEELGNQTGLIHNKGNLAFMYHRMGNTEHAKEVYTGLVSDLIAFHDSINLAVVYYHLSMFSEALSQYDSMLLYLKKSLTVSEEISDTSLLITLYGKIGQHMLNNHQYDSAGLLLSISLKMAEAIDDYISQRQVLRLLLSLDTLSGNYRNAARRLKSLMVATDSVYRHREKNNIESIELKYENQKKGEMIELQNRWIKEERKLNRLFKLLFLASVISIGFLIVIIHLIRGNNARKKQILQDQLRLKECKIVSAEKDELIHRLQIENLENEIRIKEREQVSSALSLEQKNELLGMINDKIKIAMASDGILSIPALNGIVGQIRDQLKDSSKLDLFNQQFSRLHTKFFEKLKTAHPELTKSELKFCAFLKLKLSSHQISSILNVSPEAIRKSRYRIRKKMNLSREIILEDYISRF